MSKIKIVMIYYRTRYNIMDEIIQKLNLAYAPIVIMYHMSIPKLILFSTKNINKKKQVFLRPPLATPFGTLPSGDFPLRTEEKEWVRRSEGFRTLEPDEGR
jgi:hypothetical protein